MFLGFWLQCRAWSHIATVQRPLLLAGSVALLAASCGLSTAGELVVSDADPGSIEPDDGAVGSDSTVAEYADGGLSLELGDVGIGTNDPDGAAPTSNCNFAGTWGSLLTIDVAWMPEGFNLQTLILSPGSGAIKQWIKSERVQQGTSLVDTTVVCGVDLPDFQGTALVGDETYGVLFPDSLFDDNYLPSFQVDGTVTGFASGAAYTSSPAAALIGLTMANPTTDPWPSSSMTIMATDPDRDGKPGVTVNEAVGGSYSLVPVGIPAPFQASVLSQKLYVAIRQVTSVTGTVTDCDHIEGTVTIPQIMGQAAINSHVLGCELLDGGDCTTAGSSSQASFVDNSEPVFTPSGTTKFESVRMPAGTDCATIRMAMN
jgi:hypothetical protein